MTTLARVCWALVLLGIVGGVYRHRMLIADEVAPSSDGVCADCVAIDVDLHAHTRYSDGFLSPMELVLSAKRKGLHAIAVTEHNVVFPARMAAWFSELVDGPVVLVGEEITTRDYHLIAVGIERDVEPNADLGAVIAEIHAQGGVAIAAHPTKRYWPAFEAVRNELDGAEVVHPAAYSYNESFSWHDMVAFYEEDASLAAIGSSDFHFFDALGVCRTQVMARDVDARAIVEAVREGNTRTQAPDGRVFGRPGGRFRALPAAYAPVDAVDAVTRALGWFGAVGLLLFRRRRKAAS